MMHPVSVIVPHKRSRGQFFQRFCLPSIAANRPEQIIVEINDGLDPRDAAKYRNVGAKKATQPFLLFVDDDAILGADCIEKMIAALNENITAMYAYSNFCQITMPGVPRTMRDAVQLHEAGKFDPVRLKHYNYIHTTSLIRREAFPGFDEQLARFQDWDLWLTLLRLGHAGVHVNEALYQLFYNEAGITSTKDPTEFMEIVQRKHGI